MTDKRDGKRTANGAYTWARAGYGWRNFDNARAIGQMMLDLDPGNEIGRRLVDDKIGQDFPTPNDVALDPVGKRVLLWDHDLGDPGWGGVKHLDRAWPKAAPRVDTPVVRRNTTKADRGLGAVTADRIKAAGGTGIATVGDGYLARYGLPKGSTADVTWVSDTHADVATVGPDGEPRTVRVKWSRFTDDPPAATPETPVDGWFAAPDGPFTQLLKGTLSTDEIDAAARQLFDHDLGGGYRSEVFTANIDGEGIRVIGRIKVDGSDEAAGSFERIIGLSADGGTNIIAFNKRLHLTPEHQQRGIGTRFREATETSLAAAGVHEVRVAASTGSSSNGAYTWARAGYGWRTNSAGNGSRAVGAAILERDPSSALGKRLAKGDIDSADYPTPNEVALDPVGKLVLLDHVNGIEWSGVKKLTPNSAAPEPVEAPTVVDISKHPATIFGMADWETTRPWEVTRDPDSLDPSDLLLNGERAPSWLRLKSGHGQEASFSDDHIVVTPKFFDHSESARRAILYHEAGHGLSDRMLEDGSAWDLVEMLPESGDLDGHTTPGEIAAEAYSMLWSDPEWLDRTAPAIRDLVTAKAREHGYPLHVSAPSPAPKPYVDPSRPYLSEPPVELHPSRFDHGSPSGQRIREWLALPGLTLDSDDAQQLHDSKLAWLRDEGAQRGWAVKDIDAAVAAIDEALDQSTDTLIWTRTPLDDAVRNVDNGIIDTPLERGVVLQRAYTDAVWETLYGDAATIPVSRVVDAGADSDPFSAAATVSWTVRDNEQQVVDWFTARGLAPQVVHADLPRGRALLLPWGEGRYRSNYVRIKGEVLATAPPSGPYTAIVDPDMPNEQLADIVFGRANATVGWTYGAARMTGPPHAQVPQRTLDTTVTFTPTDGEPFQVNINIDVRPEIGATPGSRPVVEIAAASHLVPAQHHKEFDNYLMDVATAAGADRVLMVSPEAMYGRGFEAAKEFATDWRWASNIDPYTVRHSGAAILGVDPGNPVGEAWAKYDGFDPSTLPQPSDLFTHENYPIIRDVSMFSYVGERDLTGRKAVPAIPQLGGYVAWGDVLALPEGTVIGGERDLERVEHVLRAGDTAADLRAAFLGGDGTFPDMASVVRYPLAPFPDPPDPPAPFPGVEVPEGVTPALPYLYPGQLMQAGKGSGELLSQLPVGAVFRQADGDGTEVDWKIVAPGYATPAHRQFSEPVKVSDYDFKVRGSVGYRVVSLPDPPPSAGDEDQRFRASGVEQAARVALARMQSDAEAGTDTSEGYSLAVGEVRAVDWMDVQRHAAAHRQLFEQHFDRLRSGNGTDWATRDPNAETARVWRLQTSTSDPNRVLFVDTPIDGVEPEVLSEAYGSLPTDAGTLYWARADTAVRWYPHTPSSLSDADIEAKLAAVGVPPASGDDIQSWGLIERVSGADQPTAEDVRRWLTYESKARRVALGPPQLVWFGRDGALSLLPYPLGSPEARKWGFQEGADTLILPVSDPRIVDVIKRHQWASPATQRQVAETEIEMVAGPPRQGWERSAARVVLDNITRARVAPHTSETGNVRLVRDGANLRFAEPGADAPLDAIVNADDIRLVTADGTVYLSRDTIIETFGIEAVTPDYSTALSDAPWDERVASLREQRDKLVFGIPGGAARVDAWFQRPRVGGYETSVWSDRRSPETVEHLRRVDSLAEFGSAVARLAKERATEIGDDPTMRYRYAGGVVRHGNGERTPATAQQAAAAEKFLNDVADAPFGGTGGPFRDDPAFADMTERLRSGEASVMVRSPTRLSISAIPAGDGQSGAEPPVAIDLVKVAADYNGDVWMVEVWDSESGTLDFRDYLVQPGAAKWLASATPFDALRMPDHASLPSLNFVALVDTMEALGVDMGTDPDLPIALGNKPAKPLRRAKNAAGRAAELGLAPYPRSWTSTLRDRPQTIRFSNGEFYRKGGGDNLSTGASNTITMTRDAESLNPGITVHEFGHSFERSVPGLVEAEAWLLASRIADRPEPVDTYGEVNGRMAYVYRDGFRRAYSGRVYNENSIDGNTSFELFTTAMEEFGRSFETGKDSLLAWVVGLLAAVQPVENGQLP